MQHIVNPFLFPSLPFDPVKDFTPVTLMTKAYIVLDVNPDVPVQNVKELIAYAKVEARRHRVGLGRQRQHVASRARALQGARPACPPRTCRTRGRRRRSTTSSAAACTAMFDGVITSLPQIKAGKVKPLAVASRTRSPLLPDVPTMAEAGVPGFETVGLAAILAPSGTPPAIVDKLYREIAAILKMPEVKSQLEAMGLEVVGELADGVRGLHRRSNRRSGASSSRMRR